MNKTIVAIYDDIVVARQVVEDLVNADFDRSSISLITNDSNNQYSHYLDKDYTPKEDAVTAGEGAGFGAVVGALTGVLVGLAALTIPGIGLAIVAGPIVGALTGALAGAVTGGVVGALVKSGVPEDEAPYYAEGIRRGGTLVSVETSDTLRAQDILNRQSAINIHERINLWRHEGWKGFNDELESLEDKDVPAPLPVTLTTTTTYTTTVNAVPAPADARPITIEPALRVHEEETLIDDEDTAQSWSAMEDHRLNEEANPVTPIPKVMNAEPALVVIEESPQVEEDDTAKSFPGY